MSDRKIARAAHPVIHAWRFEENGIIHQDNDDDGETAAGGRLAHLLQILVRFSVARRDLKFIADLPCSEGLDECPSGRDAVFWRDSPRTGSI